MQTNHQLTTQQICPHVRLGCWLAALLFTALPGCGPASDERNAANSPGATGGSASVLRTGGSSGGDAAAGSGGGPSGGASGVNGGSGAVAGGAGGGVAEDAGRPSGGSGGGYRADSGALGGAGGASGETAGSGAGGVAGETTSGGSGGVAGSTTGGGAGGASGDASAGSGGSGVTGPWPPSDTFTNPVLWEDLADLEVIRVDDTYYYTASTMHYSPGAPILRSYDLVNWEFIGHSVPVLDFGPAFDLDGGRAYVNGIWASSLGYRESNETFYWIGCMHGGGGGYVYTATAPEGPWAKHTSRGCYYDVGLLIDDDDTMYVAYGNTTISVAQLSPDGFGEVRAQQVFTTPPGLGPLEGSRFYKINGDYYILVTQYANGEYVLRSTSGPFGPYTLQPFAVGVPSPVPGAGYPHQGGLVETQNGDWYYMAFIDAYPGGRVPVLAPVTWNAEGWPSVTLVGNAWGASYPYPDVPRPATATKPPTGVDTFAEATLGPEWEWNHNPDNSKWSAGGQLTLQTATVTRDLCSARNTLTHRILGPSSTATIALDYSNMNDGDVAGFAIFRDSSAWVGIKQSGGASYLTVVDNITMGPDWNTTNTGTEVASQPVSGGTIWLRISVDIRPGANSQAHFSYSTDGNQFTSIGPAFTMNNAWQFFMGYRFAIFNYATQTLGGFVSVSSFELDTP